MNNEPAVFVVDKDERVRSSICKLARSMGLVADSYCSAEEFLEQFPGNRPGCLITGIRLFGMSGLELQERVRELDPHLPVVVITAKPETRLTVRALRGGALTLLEKPFEEHELWDAIREALKKNAKNRSKYEKRQRIRRRIEQLTPTQRKVMGLIVEGKSNKCIANELDLGMRTVESRRREVFDVMKAKSVAELVRLAIEAGSEL